jgi:hypothetical protein
VTVHRRRQKSTPKTMGWAEYFGEEVLFYHHQSRITIKADVETSVFILYPGQFQALAKEYPDIRKRLSETARSRRIGYQRQFQWLQDDEIIYFISQKHFMYFLKSLILPGLVCLFAALFLYFGLRDFSPAQPMTLTLWIGLLSLTFGLIWVLWKLIDWRNDFYIVSNEGVTWVEKIVLLYDGRLQSLLEKVRAVDRTTSLFGRWLHYGDVIANAYVGKIPMVYAYKPDSLHKFIEELRSRRTSIVEAEDIEEIRKAVDDAVRYHRNPRPEDVIKVIHGPKPPPKKPKLTLRQRFQIWTNQFRVRYEIDGVITYRKHWPVLLGKLWAPLMLTILWFITTGLLIAGVIPQNLSRMILFLLLLAGFGLVLWIWYVHADWRNDIYQLTDRQILDIEKKPLGTEVKKTANLENILSVEHDRIGIFGIIFNYGNVIINIGEAKLVFLGVYYPDQVHADVVSKQEAQQEKVRQDKKKQERERMINYLLAYYDATREAEREHIVQTVYSWLRRMKLIGVPSPYAQAAEEQQTWQPLYPQTPLYPPGPP